MERGDVSVMVTVGQLARAKCSNFVDYCLANFKLPREDAEKLHQLQNLGEVALLAALKEELHPHAAAVRAREITSLPEDFRRLAQLIEEHDDSSKLDTVWRYLELFCDILDLPDKQNANNESYFSN